MSLYYDGDLDKDLEQLNEFQIEAELSKKLDEIGKQIGFGRAQQILQVLWAKRLREQGLNTNGALFR